MIRKTLVLVVSVVCVAAACGKSGVRRTVENGIEVVTNGVEPTPVRGRSSRLRLEPDFTINLADPVLAEAGLTDPVSLDLDSEGNIYVAAQIGKPHYLFKFDPRGRFVGALGRVGQGPGEVGFLLGFCVSPRDELVITPGRESKVVILDRDGNLVREIRNDSQGPMFRPLTSTRALTLYYEPRTEAGPYWGVFRLCDERLRTVKDLKRIIVNSGNGRLPGVSGGMLFEGVGERVVCGDSSDGYQFTLFDLEGRPVRMVRKDFRPRPVTAEDRKRIGETRFGGNAGDLARVDWPDRFPPYQYGFTDRESWIFVETHEPGSRPKEYLVDAFDRDGACVARFALDNGSDGFMRTTLFATARKGKIYYLREREDGFKEIVVKTMVWE